MSPKKKLKINEKDENVALRNIAIINQEIWILLIFDFDLQTFFVVWGEAWI